jgi:hypothetical protein
MAQLKNTTISDTGSIDLPVGTTGQRPGSPIAAMIRYNTTLSETEYYDGTAWRPLSDSNPEATGGTIVDTDIGGVPYRIHYFTNTGNTNFVVTKGGEVEYLIVAGGGGGSNRHQGGGGAGGLLVGTTTVTSQSYTITVGAGGAGVAQTVLPTVGSGTNGNNSSAFGLTAIGGGRGSDQPGGSGGGGGAGATIGGSGTVGQGNNGGRGSANFVTECSYCGGGGGGAGSPGTGATLVTPCTSGDGGQGILSTIAGVSNFYAGGGGGGGAGCSVRGGFGGLGGGGTGGRTFDINEGQSGTVNTGGGGGSGAFVGSTNYASGAGGSGIVIVRYRRNQSTATNPTRTTIATQPNNFQIIRDGLVVNLDAANLISYPGSGTTWTDLSGRGNNGTLVNGASYSSVNGGVIVLNGVNGYIDVPINLTNTTYTVMGAARYVTIGGRTFSGQSTNWLMGNWSSTTENHFAAGWVTNVQSGPSDTNWRIYAATGDFAADSWQLYVNGVLTAGPNNGGSNGPNGFSIGRYGPGNSEYSNSHIGFLICYNRVLTTQEIRQNFDALRGRFGI